MNRDKSKYLGFLTLTVLTLLAACTSAVNEATPTTASSVTPEPTRESVVASCGGPIAQSSSEPLTALFSQRDGYVWALPDGTDAIVTLDDVRDSDPLASDSTAMSFPLWAQPAVSPDQLQSAMTILRRYSGSSVTRTMVVLSDTENPVLGTLVLPEDYVQALVTLSWLPESGCLAVLVFEPMQPQQLYVLQTNGDVIAQFQPKLGRGTVLDVTASGWIVLDRLTWEHSEIELFKLDSSGTTIVVSSGQVVPDFPGLAGSGMTAEQFVASLRN